METKRQNTTVSDGYRSLVVGMRVTPSKDTDAWSCGLRIGTIVDKLPPNKLLPRTIVVDFEPPTRKRPTDLRRWLYPRQVIILAKIENNA